MNDRSRSPKERHHRNHHHHEHHCGRASRSSSRHRGRASYSRSRSRSPAVVTKRHESSPHRSRSRGHHRARSHSRSPMSSRKRHLGSRENPSANKCLGVFGLSLRTNERDLRDVFTRYGPIDECTVVIDAQSGRSRGFAFIYYENVDDAKVAKEACNGIEIDGRRIRVDFSITKRAHTPTPGIYMGKPTYGRNNYDSRRRDDYRGYRRSPSPYYSRRRGGGRRSHSRSRSPHTESMS